MYSNTCGYFTTTRWACVGKQLRNSPSHLIFHENREIINIKILLHCIIQLTYKDNIFKVFMQSISGLLSYGHSVLRRQYLDTNQNIERLMYCPYR